MGLGSCLDYKTSMRVMKSVYEGGQIKPRAVALPTRQRGNGKIRWTG